MDSAWLDCQSDESGGHGVQGDVGIIVDFGKGFQCLLEANGLAEPIFADFNALLTENGLLLRQGTLVDTTLIAAPSSTKNAKGKWEPENIASRPRLPLPLTLRRVT